MIVRDVAELVGGELVGIGDAPIGGVAPVVSAGPADLAFVAHPQYVSYLEDCQAGAVLIARALRTHVPARLDAIVVDDAHRALVRVLPALYPERRGEAVVHPAAVVHPTARIEPDVGIAPGAVVGEGVELRRGVRVGANCYIGDGCVVGADSTLHPGVTLYAGVRVGGRCIIHSGARLGADGFGFVWADGRHAKVPQVGGCEIGDDVEIGANTTIDRGSIGDTVIGSGCKIDNLVHIGHNVQMGQHVLVVAQVGVSGSTVIGDHAVLGGQAGIAGHLTIGARARIGAQAGVTRDVAVGETVSGYPARPHREALRAQAILFRLPRILERLRDLEQVIGTSRSSASPQATSDEHP